MEAVRIIRKIKNDRLSELNDFIGKSVEIIILPGIEETKNSNILNELVGSCPDLPDGLDFQKKIRTEWEK